MLPNNKYNLNQELADNIFNKNKITGAISRDHNNGYNRKFKCVDNKKNQFVNNKLLRYEAYQVYRSKPLTNDYHINYISFCKVLIYLFNEILYQGYVNKKSWFISRVGTLTFNTVPVKKGNFIVTVASDCATAETDMIRVFGKIRYYKRANLFTRRFKFLMYKKIKKSFVQDYVLYKRSFVHKKSNDLKTYM